jgi:diguanylate cyclase (GGDEF)-like protein
MVLAQAGPWREAFAPHESGPEAVAWAWLISAHLVVLSIGREGPLVRWSALLHAAAIALSGLGVHLLAPGLGGGRAGDYLAFPGVPAVPFALGAALSLGLMLAGGRALAAALSVTLLALSLSSEGWLLHSAPALLIATCQLALLVALLEESYRLAYHDALTGLPGRRALTEAMEHLGGRYALAMVDIDHFKRFNDRHGHEVGDQVLRMVARELAHVGSGGRAYRYGGEEFAIVFPGCDATEARQAVDETRKTIAGRRFVIRAKARPRRKPKGRSPRKVGTKKVRITVSGGVSEPSRRRVLPREVLVAADKALYKAKRAGRNRVS